MDITLARGQLWLLSIAASYAAFLALLTVPYVQTHAIFLHAIHWPLFAELDNPIKYGLPSEIIQRTIPSFAFGSSFDTLLSAGRSINVHIETADKVRLGAWLVLPPSKSKQAPFHGPPNAGDITESISNRPTILFFHGNAATRAVSFRVQYCSTYATRFNANVLAIDYRGFGDSEGSPSEKGLIADARAAWDWTIHLGARPEDILLVGVSLGTGVISGLGAQLAKEDVHPKGLVLLSPFTSLKSLLTEYRLFGIFPVLQPLEFFRPLHNFFTTFLVAEFNTIQALPDIKAPILIAHSKDDCDIPQKHSHNLFNALLEELLPPTPAIPSSPSELKNFDWTSFKAISEERRSLKSSLVIKQEIPKFAKVNRFSRPNGFDDVIFVEASYGGHDRIGLQNSLIDLIDSVFF